MTDNEILTLYWQRSQQAVEETEKAYGRYCHCIASRILRNDEDAGETVNDAYFKAWNRIPPERPSSLKHFLGVITRQLAINRLEKNTAAKRGGEQYMLVFDELAECVSGNEMQDPAELLALRDVLNRFLAEQPARSRRIFVQRYWYMYSIAEIAANQGVGQSKVKMQLRRTWAKLKEYLLKEGFSL